MWQSHETYRVFKTPNELPRFFYNPEVPHRNIKFKNKGAGIAQAVRK